MTIECDLQDLESVKAGQKEKDVLGAFRKLRIGGLNVFLHLDVYQGRYHGFRGLASKHPRSWGLS